MTMFDSTRAKPLRWSRLPPVYPFHMNLAAWRPEEEIGKSEQVVGDEVEKTDGGGNSAPPPSNKRKREKLSPGRAVVVAALNAAMTPEIRRRIAGKRTSLAVVVEVPGAGWVPVLDRHFRDLPIGWETFARTGNQRSRDKSDIGNDEVCRSLGAGGRVAGIAANTGLLPSSLLAAADITIRIAAPTGAVIREAMRLCLTGRLPKTIEDGIVAGLEFEDIVAALRKGSTPAEALSRLGAAARQRAGRDASGGAPALETAVEYGEARAWGLALARDIAEFRAGRLQWRECDRGAVLYSDPGCGKSVLAASIAQACGIPLIRASVAEYFATVGDCDLGTVIKAQRATFARAAAVAPALLFLDEIDAMPDRRTLSPRGRDWWMPVINDFLLLLDSAVSGQREGLVVLGATNRIEAVDPALLRPGRLERAIEIKRPDVAGVVNILRFHLGGDLAGTDLTDIAGMIEGATAAEIMDLVRTARRAARHDGRAFSVDDLRSAAFGEAASEDPDFLRRAAVHEAGHAVAASIHRPGSVICVSLQARGPGGGFTKMAPPRAKLFTLQEIEEQVIESLCGGEAERVVLGQASTGAGGGDESDIARATRVISALHASTTLAGAPVYLCAARDALEAIRLDPLLRTSVQKHLETLMARAHDLVGRHQSEIIEVADELARRRILSGDEVLAIMRGPPVLRQPQETVDSG